MRRPPSIELVESVYEGVLSRSPRAWLAHVVEALASRWPGNLGVVGYAYEMFGDPAGWQISFPVAFGGSPELASGVHESFVHAPAGFRRRLFSALRPAGTFSETTGKLLTEQHRVGARAAKKLGASDAIYINAVDPDGRGALLAINHASSARLSPSERRQLSMLSAHLGVARRLACWGRRPGNESAIFSAKGALEHVEPEHQASIPRLRERIARLADAQRPSARRYSEQRLAAWKALVEGRYTLLNRFDSDGRRYVVAYDNPPGVHDPRGLTRLEASVCGWACRGHSQKLIAYELGLGVGTVSGLLSRVFRKLGVSSRAELIQLLEAPAELARVPVPGGESLLVFSSPERHSDHRLAPLSPAEREVATLASAGRSNLEIAKVRGTSSRTVAHQLGEVFRKLEVGSRAELCARLLRDDRRKTDGGVRTSEVSDLRRSGVPGRDRVSLDV